METLRLQNTQIFTQYLTTHIKKPAIDGRIEENYYVYIFCVPSIVYILYLFFLFFHPIKKYMYNFIIIIILVTSTIVNLFN